MIYNIDTLGYWANRWRGRRSVMDIFYRIYLKVGIGVTVDGKPLLVVLDCYNRVDHDVPDSVAIAHSEIWLN